MSGAAQQFMERFFGGFVAVTERTLTLTTTTQEVLRNNPERVGFLIVVTGSTTAQLAFGPAPTAAASILIGGSGGSFRANVREDFTMVTHALNGNVASGTTTLLIVEIARVSEPVSG